MPTKLTLYNDATLHLTERKVANLGEGTVLRRRLDTAWDTKVVESCLSRGFWKFATRSMRMDYDPSYTQDWGYQYAFPKTDDWVKTILVSCDEFFGAELTDMTDEAQTIYANVSQIFAKIVSKGDDYGMDLGNWPVNFAHFVGASLALKVIQLQTGGNMNDRVAMEGIEKRLLIRARGTDAMDAPTQQADRGSWSRAREGNGFIRRGRGRY